MFRIAVTEGTAAPTVEIIKADEVLIGRVTGNDIVLATGNVSKQHARIAFQGGQLVIFDLKSTNGTSVNGRKITAPTPVGNDDAIQIGEFKLTILSAIPSISLAVLQDVTQLTVMASHESAVEQQGARAPSLHEQTPVLAAYELANERTPTTNDDLLPVRPSTSSPPVWSDSRIPAPPVGPAPLASRLKPASTSSEIGRLALTTHVANTGSSSGHRPPAPSDARPDRDSPELPSEQAMTVNRRLSVPREPFWDDARFRKSWQAAIERLTEEVPIEELPSGLHIQPHVLRAFEERTARIVMGLPESKPLSHAHLAALSAILAHSAVGLGPIDSYLQDPRVQALTLTDEGHVELHLEAGNVSESVPAPLEFTHRPLAQRIRDRLLGASMGSGIDGFQVLSAAAMAGSGSVFVRLQRIGATGISPNLLPFAVVERVREMLKRDAAILVVIPESQRGTWGAVRAVVDSLDTARKAWVASDPGAAELERQSIGADELQSLRWCPVPLVLDASNPSGWAAWLRASTHASLPTVAIVNADSVHRALARVCLLTGAPDVGTLCALFDGVLRVVEESGALSSVVFQAGTPLLDGTHTTTGGGL